MIDTIGELVPFAADDVILLLKDLICSKRVVSLHDRHDMSRKTGTLKNRVSCPARAVE